MVLEIWKAEKQELIKHNPQTKHTETQDCTDTPHHQDYHYDALDHLYTGLQDFDDLTQHPTLLRNPPQSQDQDIDHYTPNQKIVMHISQNLQNSFLKEDSQIATSRIEHKIQEIIIFPRVRIAATIKGWDAYIVFDPLWWEPLQWFFAQLQWSVSWKDRPPEHNPRHYQCTWLELTVATILVPIICSPASWTSRRRWVW